ncbi:glycoside hydrolase [Auriculariales sp. MPI-PUGE-AT-0066]|nr:glycoside hydrolase [Auriculariales sp. MPI-PUGE-AT-0066]
MTWPSPCRLLCIALAGLLVPGLQPSSVAAHTSVWNARRKAEAREKTRALWYHGYDAYMKHGATWTYLRPLSCTGRGPDWNNPNNIAVNDVAGNFSVTLVDVLDTFVVLQDRPGFDDAVRKVVQHVTFDVDTRPQVFETTIRALGGLISGHIFASEPRYGFALDWYNGELLTLALDLGERLLPAFQTSTGIPYARVHLRRGVLKGETHESCTAGAGSLILEFATLSRLSGDDRFEKAAFRAFFAIWNLRSDIGLVGNTVDIWRGAWTSPAIATIGAGIDSFYEYALKWHILSGDAQFLDVWNDAYSAVMRYVRSPEGRVNMNTGDLQYHTLDSLSAFWPGLQVLAGDVENAVKSHLIYWNLWKRFAGLPEIYDIGHAVATTNSYPLRPEFIESTWYLYRATRDSFYLDVAEKVLADLTIRGKVDCGLTGIEDLKNNKRSDRMESFVLSETLKYLYLIFDDDNPINRDDSNFVFTTEAHILHLNTTHLRPMSAARRKLRPKDVSNCPAHVTAALNWNPVSERSLPLLGGIRQRLDYDYARHLAGIPPTSVLAADDSQTWTYDGWCDAPKLQPQVFDFIFALEGDSTLEDVSPSLKKLQPVADGYILHNLTGIRAILRSRPDGKSGLEITKLGPYVVRPGQTIRVRDPRLQPVREQSHKPKERPLDVRLLIDTTNTDSMESTLHTTVSIENTTIIGWTSMFGGDPSTFGSKAIRFGAGAAPLLLIRDLNNPLGCEPYQESDIPPKSVILVTRGECTFVQKLDEASLAGAAGVIVVNTDDSPLNPSMEPEDTVVWDGSLDDTALVVVRKVDGAALVKLVESSEEDGGVQVMVQVEAMVGADEEPPTETLKQPAESAILVVNGHAIANTIIDG